MVRAKEAEDLGLEAGAGDAVVPGLEPFLEEGLVVSDLSVEETLDFVLEVD